MRKYVIFNYLCLVVDATVNVSSGLVEQTLLYFIVFGDYLNLILHPEGINNIRFKIRPFFYS